MPTETPRIDRLITPLYKEAAGKGRIAKGFLEFCEHHADGPLDALFIDFQWLGAPFVNPEITVNQDEVFPELSLGLRKIYQRMVRGVQHHFPTSISCLQHMVDLLDPIVFQGSETDPIGRGLDTWFALEALLVRARESLHAALSLHAKRYGDSQVALGTCLEVLRKFDACLRDEGFLKRLWADSLARQLRNELAIRNARRKVSGVSEDPEAEAGIARIIAQLRRFGYEANVEHGLSKKRPARVTSIPVVLTDLERKVFGDAGEELFKGIAATRDYQAHGSAAVWEAHAVREGGRVIPIRAEILPEVKLSEDAIFIAGRYCSAVKALRPQLAVDYGRWYVLLMLTAEARLRSASGDAQAV